MTKLNKNLIIELLMDEVERLKAVNKDTNDELNRMFDVHYDLNQLNDEMHQGKMDLIAQCDNLRNQLSRAENARDWVEQNAKTESDYYSVENVAIRRAEEAESQLARARITLDELELLMTPCSITGKKIETIKLARRVTDAGLRECKNLVEDCDRVYQERVEWIQQEPVNSKDQP